MGEGLAKPPAALAIGPAPHRPLAIAALALLAAAACLFLALTTVQHIVLYATVLTLAGLACVPAGLSMTRGRLDYFELIHPFSLIYFLNFGLGAVLTYNNPLFAYDIHTVPYVPKAALYGLLGYICLLAGYYGPWNNRSETRTRPAEITRGPLLLLSSGVLGLIGYMAWAQNIRADRLGERTVSGLASLLGQFSPLFLFAWALGWLLVWSGKASRSQKAVMLLVLAPGGLLILRSYLSSKTVGVTLFLIPMAAFWYSRRRLPWKALLALVLVMIFVIFPLYNTYRVLDPLTTVEDRVTMTVDSMSRWDSGTYLERSVGTFASRMALVNSLAVVLRDVGRWVPYRDWRPLVLTPAILVIPRALWPDKPKLNVGREFGQGFRIVNPHDTDTSIAPSLPGELYWYFDLPGIVLGMMLIGAALRWFYRRYGPAHDRFSPVHLAIYLALLPKILTTEGGIVASTIGILKVLLVLAILRWVIGRMTGTSREATPQPVVAG